MKSTLTWGPRARNRPISSGPPQPGIMTSVTIRSMVSEWIAKSFSASFPFSASSTL